MDKVAKRNTHAENFPRAILHIDGDSFFVSCELTRRLELRGKPCVTGAERGIATAVNPEAKALGVVRGMRIRDIRNRYGSVHILESDYDLYSDIAQRMYAIVRQYTDDVEEYSIDECFADITGWDKPLHMTYEEIASSVQRDLIRELGVTFSVGLGVNKVTAKIASKWKKPAGLTIMSLSDIPTFLANLPVGKVWGIGGRTAIYVRKLGINTAGDLARKDRIWVAEYCDKPLAEIWEEFQGNYVKLVEGGPEQHDFASVQRSRTFWPTTRDPVFLWSQISYHVEDACAKLRAGGGSGQVGGVGRPVGGKLAKRAHIMLKTQDFSYIRREVELPEPTSAPDVILNFLRPHFEEMFRGEGGDAMIRAGLIFRATGVILSDLVDAQVMTGKLFEAPARLEKSHTVHGVIDSLAAKFGRSIVFLGSSLKALKAEGNRKSYKAKRPVGRF